MGAPWWRAVAHGGPAGKVRLVTWARPPPSQESSPLAVEGDSRRPLLHGTAPHRTLLHGTALYCTAQHSVQLTTRHATAAFYSILQRSALHLTPDHLHFIARPSISKRNAEMTRNSTCVRGKPSINRKHYRLLLHQELNTGWTNALHKEVKLATFFGKITNTQSIGRLTVGQAFGPKGQLLYFSGEL